jgi:hypothetical protein
MGSLLQRSRRGQGFLDEKHFVPTQLLVERLDRTGSIVLALRPGNILVRKVLGQNNFLVYSYHEIFEEVGQLPHVP